MIEKKWVESVGISGTSKYLLVSSEDFEAWIYPGMKDSTGLGKISQPSLWMTLEQWKEYLLFLHVVIEELELLKED